MKIGIIVHSHTGHTLSVAERLRDRLISEGNEAAIEQVTAVNEDPNAAPNAVLKDIPQTEGYDVLLFGAPVRGFALSPVMKLYLSGLPEMEDKKVGCFVTQTFRWPWLGGNGSIKTMKTVCEGKGARVFDTGIVNWSHPERDKLIDDMVLKLSKV